MIDIERYNNLKEKYGACSSWTIWKEAGPTPKSYTGDMSIFNDANICDKLNDKYVFIGLNGSSTHGKQEIVPWKNFHSDYKGQNDFKLRYALKNTPFWGSYITDIIKKYHDVDSNNVMNYLKKNPDIVDKNIMIFEEELSILSDEKPVLIAMGNNAHDIVSNHFGKKYRVFKITHYSHFISKEKYRESVEKDLAELY